jgi:hypothetical protein
MEQRPLLDRAVDEEEAAAGSPPPAQAAAKPTSLFQTALNIANTLEGMGLLCLPYAVRLAGGYAFGAIALVCAASCWTAIVIAATLYDPEKLQPAVAGGSVRWVRARRTYVENATAAFGTAGGVATLLIQVGTLISV